MTALMQVMLTFCAAFVFGFERQKARKPIGFGTFIFVATGASALGIIAMQIETDNPLPLLSAVVTGIGFLGAGALIKNGDRVHGFTSAALIWIFAIFGLAIGLKEYAIAVTIYVLIWLVTLVDKHLETEGIGAYQKNLFLNISEIISLSEIEGVIAGIANYKLISLKINNKENSMSVVYHVAGRQDSLMDVIAALQHHPWLESSRIE